MNRGFFAAPLLLVALPPMCSSKTDPAFDPANVPGTVEVVNVPEPPKPTLIAEPVSAFADASANPEADEKSPLDQAREYHARGQNWVARLLVEKRALAPENGKPEAELLLEICRAQNDAECVQQCAKKLGRKIAFDGGVAPAHAGTPSAERPVDTPFSKARDLHLKGKDKEARALLEARVIDGKAPTEETRLLLDICKKQGDKMCVALCTKQLPH